jgi:hypothetical protein
VRQGKWPPEGAIVEKLLKLAEAPDSLITRRALQHRLDQARLLYRAFAAEQEAIPRENYTKVASSARKLQAAIIALRRHWEPRGRCWLGERDRTTVLELLPRIVAAADREAEPRKKSRPRRDDVRSIVDRAALFYDKYSAAPVTSYADGRFAKFAREFLTVVTGLSRDKLESYLREAAKRTKLRRDISAIRLPD